MRAPVTQELIDRWLDRADRLALEHGGNVEVARERAWQAILERDPTIRRPTDHPKETR